MVAARNGRADWAALGEPRTPVPSEAEGLASGPIQQFFNDLLNEAGLIGSIESLIR